MTDTAGLSHANANGTAAPAPAKTMTPTAQTESLSPFNTPSISQNGTTTTTSTSATNSTSTSPSTSSSTPPQSATTTTTDPQDLSSVIAECHHRVHTFLQESHPPNSLLASVQRQTRTSLAVIATALTRYNPVSELSLSYNGGKDCLVLLILFLAGLHPHPRPQEGGLASIPSIYALPPDPFPAVEDFVRWSARAYHLEIVKYTTHPPHATLRSSFKDYLDRCPSIKAIFVGTRRTDPHGAKLTHFRSHG